MGNARNSLPLQGAQSLACDCRYAGEAHAPRNPSYTSNNGHFFIHFLPCSKGIDTSELLTSKTTATPKPRLINNIQRKLNFSRIDVDVVVVFALILTFNRLGRCNLCVTENGSESFVV